jgi:opacity protein-like surface antigen
MRSRSLALSAVLIALLASAALAADVSGKWKAEFKTPDGQMFVTNFDFEVSGGTLTGTVSSQMGESKISEGTVNGDEISFVVVRKREDNEFKMNYKGKVSGDEMKLTITMAQMDRTFEMTATRVK